MEMPVRAVRGNLPRIEEENSHVNVQETAEYLTA